MANFSILTNAGAQVALQSLNKINKGLDVSQTRVTTGLRVNGPKDDASSYTIAQRMRGAVAGNESVKIALANGESVVNTAVEAGKSISDLLTEMKAKVVQANQAGLDSSSRSALQNDFDGLRTQIATIVASASFNSTNLIDASATTFTVLSTQEGSTITVSAQKLDTTTLGIQASDLTSSANASTALTAINSAISLVADKLAALGSAAKRIDVQTEFTGKLTDILKQGIGNLVDADLADESANLQSLQIRQQLGTQALSIANQRPSSILSLFR
jgi:flagellin